MMKMKNLITLCLVCISLTMFSQTENSESESHFKPFSIYVNGGLGHRLDDSFAGVKEFKMGYSLQAGANYYFNPKWGVGLKYARFGSKVTYNMTGLNPYKSINKLGLDYVGVSVARRFVLQNPRHSFTADAGAGYLSMSYTHEGNYKTEISGGNIGFSLNGAYEYSLSGTVALGLQVGFITASLSKVEGKFPMNHIEHGQTMETVTLKTKDSYTWMHLGVGIRVFL